MFGDGDPFSDFFHTFFGGSAGRRSVGTRPRRARAWPARVATSNRRSSSASRTRITVRRAASRSPSTGTSATSTSGFPPAIGDGSRVRVGGEGEQGSGGAESGDLYLRIRLTPHPSFERKGRDLYTRVSIPLTTAVLGGEAEVRTLGGKSLRLKVPPTTQQGQVFRLKGQGMPVIGKPDEHGDLVRDGRRPAAPPADAGTAYAFRGTSKTGEGDQQFRRLSTDDEHQQVHREGPGSHRCRAAHRRAVESRADRAGAPARRARRAARRRRARSCCEK